MSQKLIEAPVLKNLKSLKLGANQTAFAWLGQAGFALYGRETLILVDPFLSEYPGRQVKAAFDPAQASGVHVVLCTHEHLDHFDSEAVSALSKSSPDAVFVVPAPIVGMVSSLGIEPDRIRAAQPGQPITLGNLAVHPVPAAHGVEVADAYNFGHELSGGQYRYLGYVLDSGVRTYHSGDTILYEDMVKTLKALDVEVAFLPINGRSREREAEGLVGNLNEQEAAQLAADIGADVLVPMHYDMFASNPGRPDLVVEIVRRAHLQLTVVVPTHYKPFVLTSARTR